MIKHIFLHDLRQVLYNRRTWYYLAALQIFLGLIFNWLMRNFLKQQAMTNSSLYGITEEVLHPYYAWFTLLALVLVPTLSSQSICGERQQGTLLNLQCAPVTPLQAVLGKFVGLNILLLLSCCVISLLPCTICLSGSIDWGQVMTGLGGLYLMLSAAMAVGLAISSYMSSVTRCNILIFFSLAALVLIEWAAQYLGKYSLLYQGYGLLHPLKSFLSGILNLQFTAFYILIIYSSIFVASWGFARERSTH